MPLILSKFNTNVSVLEKFASLHARCSSNLNSDRTCLVVLQIMYMSDHLRLRSGQHLCEKVQLSHCRILCQEVNMSPHFCHYLLVLLMRMCERDTAMKELKLLNEKPFISKMCWAALSPCQIKAIPTKVKHLHIIPLDERLLCWIHLCFLTLSSYQSFPSSRVAFQ